MNLVHHMGGTIRKDFSTKVSILIAYSTHGEKYRVGGCECVHASLPVFFSVQILHKKIQIHSHYMDAQYTVYQTALYIYYLLS